MPFQRIVRVNTRLGYCSMNPKKIECNEVDSCVIKCLMVKLYIMQSVMYKTNLKNSNISNAINSRNQFIERQHRKIFFYFDSVTNKLCQNLLSLRTMSSF